MGWGGILKGILGAGSIAAAPFTGGTSLAWLPAALGAGGAVLSGMGKDAATNRGGQFEGQIALERLLQDRDAQLFNQTLQREQEGRAGASDAWKKLLSAQRVLNPAQRPNVTPYAAPQRQFSEAERTGASALSEEVLARLMGGNQIPMPERREMAVDPRLLKAGGMERAAGWLAPLLGYLGKPRSQPMDERYGTYGNVAMPMPAPRRV